MNWKPIRQYRDRHFREDEREGLRLFDRWAESTVRSDGKGLTRYTAGVSGLDWPRILLTGRLAWLAGIPDDPPELEHAVLFRSHDGRCWLTYQPYALPEDVRDRVKGWAKEHGLAAEVYPPSASWYFPGDTCLVVITRKEKENP